MNEMGPGLSGEYPAMKPASKMRCSPGEFPWVDALGRVVIDQQDLFFSPGKVIYEVPFPGFIAAAPRAAGGDGTH